ncbi:B3 domain-containing protein At3g25182-like [Camellia sinensis]|uniref:B3 domain-containing protein At3g25182-like n=1 Tax=Camellia sinensis TaxID=4442 RepID=UPI00103696AD|nr:B3 domain-containing protein At3g25182-like [Camellia sinensis]
MSDSRNSTHKSLFDDDDHTHSATVDREGSKKNGVASPCSFVIDVDDDDDDDGDDRERSPFRKSVVIPKEKRSECYNKNSFIIVPVNHISEVEATMTKKPIKIRCKLKLPVKSFVLKRRHSDDDDGDNKEKVRRKKKRMIVKAPAVPPELPAEFKNLIESLNGTELNLLIEKSLYSTDLNHNHRHLSLPLSQIHNGFLTQEEKDLLETRTGKHKTSIVAKLIVPSRKESDIFLKKWDTPKKVGKVNSTYNLTTSWNNVLESNKQCEGMIV